MPENVVAAASIEVNTIGNGLDNIKAISKHMKDFSDAARNLDFGKATSGLTGMFKELGVGVLADAAKTVEGLVDKTNNLKNSFSNVSTSLKGMIEPLKEISKAGMPAKNMEDALSGLKTIGGMQDELSAVAVSTSELGLEEIGLAEGATVAAGGMEGATAAASGLAGVLNIELLPIILLIGAALLTLKAMWDANFLGIADTVENLIGTTMENFDIMYDGLVSFFEQIDVANNPLLNLLGAVLNLAVAIGTLIWEIMPLKILIELAEIVWQFVDALLQIPIVADTISVVLNGLAGILNFIAESIMTSVEEMNKGYELAKSLMGGNAATNQNVNMQQTNNIYGAPTGESGINQANEQLIREFGGFS